MHLQSKCSFQHKRLNLHFHTGPNVDLCWWFFTQMLAKAIGKEYTSMASSCNDVATTMQLYYLNS